MRSTFRRLLTALREESLPRRPRILTPSRAQLFIRSTAQGPSLCPVRTFSTFPRRSLEPDQRIHASSAETVHSQLTRELPRSCPGCGALTQNVDAAEAGFYSITRSAVKKYLQPQSQLGSKKEEDRIFESAIRNVSPEVRLQLGLDHESANHETQEMASEPTTPVCDRCHNLIHYRTGQSIYHPSVQSIEDTIAESPYKRNHVYHVLDAADFPMSLVPQLEKHLTLARLRTQNRRSKSHKYVAGKEADMSFIITRSDLLAPKKEMVDAMLPKLREILRDALGSTGKSFRLGNLQCVSAKRGWWTKPVKEDIWERGGASWLVGKVNVGKSNLFEVVFPKGRNEDINLQSIRQRTRHQDMLSSVEAQSATSFELAQEPATEIYDGESLLPPPQPLTTYPVMPIVSELPGTTASPIRVPFGSGKGELIDLPGLARNTLEDYVKPEHRLDIVMKSRIIPERYVLKPRSSLLLGGIIRITPTTPDLIFMVHPFVPLEAHLTSTEKAVQIQKGTSDLRVSSIAEESAQKSTTTAGRFQLLTDVTKSYAGPLTRRDAVGLNPSNLPFTIYATDILIAGCGWVEIVAQVRKRKPPVDALSVIERNDLVAEFPEIEVFSPEGKFIGQRQSISAFLTGGPMRKVTVARRRRSMKSVKSQRKPKVA